MAFDLLRMAQREGITIEWRKFDSSIEALYWSPKDNLYFIALNHRLRSDLPKARSILAEEMGHHFTSIGSCSPNCRFRYRNRVYVSKAEYQAMCWATRYLMPFDQLMKAYKHGIREAWELATYFAVTEEVVRFRLEILGTENSHMIHLVE